jgi:hypothetical protein
MPDRQEKKGANRTRAERTAEMPRQADRRFDPFRHTGSGDVKSSAIPSTRKMNAIKNLDGRHALPLPKVGVANWPFLA